MVLLSSFFILSATQVLVDNQREKIETAVTIVEEYLAININLYSLDFSWTSNVLPALAGIGDIYMLVCDTGGVVLLQSDTQGASLVGRHLPDAVFAHVQKSEEVPGYQMRHLVPNAQITIPKRLAINTPNGQVPIGYLLISSSQLSYRRLMWQFFRSWLFIGSLTVLLAGASAYITSRRLARPLRHMAKCAHSFAHGDYSIRADVFSATDGETMELAYAFNAMAQSMQNAEELRRGFIANVSHELKTPMTTIAGFIGGVLDGTVPEERRDETLRMVYDEIMRLSRLVVSMTNLTRLQTGQLDLHPHPFDVSEMALRILLGFESKINDKDLRVALDMSESGNIWVNADPDSIIQVLTNLLDNAVKFSRKGGNLAMSIRSHGGKAHISIANEGPHIPAEDLPHIFDRFHKADRSRSHDRTGLGLGLFLVSSILHAHNENIHVSSENEQTVFSFTLMEAKGKLPG